MRSANSWCFSLAAGSWIHALRATRDKIKEERKGESMRTLLRSLDVRGVDTLAARARASGGRDGIEVGDALLQIIEAAELARAQPSGRFFLGTLLPLVSRTSDVLTESRAATILRRLCDVGALKEPSDCVRSLMKPLMGFRSAKNINHALGALCEIPGLNIHALSFVSNEFAKWPVNSRGIDDAASGNLGVPAFDSVRVVRSLSRLSARQFLLGGRPELLHDVRMLPFTRQVVQYIAITLPYLRGSHKITVIRSCEQMLNLSPFYTNDTDANCVLAPPAKSSDPLPMTPKETQEDMVLLLKATLRSVVAGSSESVTCATLDTTLLHCCRGLTSVLRCQSHLQLKDEVVAAFRTLAQAVSNDLACEPSQSKVPYIAAGDLLNAAAAGDRHFPEVAHVLRKVSACWLPIFLKEIPVNDQHAFVHAVQCSCTFATMLSPEISIRCLETIDRRCESSECGSRDPGFFTAVLQFASLVRIGSGRTLSPAIAQACAQELDLLLERDFSRESREAPQSATKRLIGCLRALAALHLSGSGGSLALKAATVLNILLAMPDAVQLKHHQIVQLLASTSALRRGLTLAIVLSDRKAALSLSRDVVPPTDSVIQLARACLDVARCRTWLADCSDEGFGDLFDAACAAMLWQCLAGFAASSRSICAIVSEALSRLHTARDQHTQSALRINVVKGLCTLEHAAMLTSRVGDCENGSLAHAALSADITSMMVSVDVDCGRRAAAIIDELVSGLSAQALHRGVTTALPFAITSCEGATCRRVASAALNGLLRG